MTRFLIEAPHTQEECLRTLDEIRAEGSKVLDKFVFGCEAGVHTGWAIVEAGSEPEARNLLPPSRRSKDRITKVKNYTSEQIESMH